MSDINKLAALADAAEDLLELRQTVAELKQEVSSLQAPRALTTAEVSKILRVSRTTVNNWAKQGRIPAILSKSGNRYPSHRIFAAAEAACSGNERKSAALAAAKK